MARQKKDAASRYREIRNSRARHDYFIDETVEAGVVLTGTEVKSIRAGQAQINDAFVRFDRGRPTLYHANIAEYSFGNFQNHTPYRPRRLLLNKREIRKWEQELKAGGKTVVPLRIYFKQGLVKVQLGLARGKKLYDKREDLKKKVDKREMERALSTRR